MFGSYVFVIVHLPKLGARLRQCRIDLWPSAPHYFKAGHESPLWSYNDSAENIHDSALQYSDDLTIALLRVYH